MIALLVASALLFAAAFGVQPAAAAMFAKSRISPSLELLDSARVWLIVAAGFALVLATTSLLIQGLGP